MAWVVEATLEHVEALAPNLRQVDRDEIRALLDIDPEEALWRSFYASTMCWSIIHDDGDIVGMFGCGQECPWLLGSERLPEIGGELARRSKEFVQLMLNEHQFLYNFVDARNKLAIRWLKWCGFTIMPTMPLGAHGEKFHPFFMAAKSANGARSALQCV